MEDLFLEQLGAIGGPFLIVLGVISISIIVYLKSQIGKAEKRADESEGRERDLIAEAKKDAKETLTALIEFNHTLEKVLDKSDLSELTRSVKNLGDKVNEILLRITQ